MKTTSPFAEQGAFRFRPNPDVSCRHLENTLLSEQAPNAGVAAVAGSAIPVVTGNLGGAPDSGNGNETPPAQPGTKDGTRTTQSASTTPDSSTTQTTSPSDSQTPVKPPASYQDGPNVWDPPADEQQQRWVHDHLIWDPQTLNYRYPRPNEIPPPAGGPENPPPYERSNPRDNVPGACITLYDQYVQAQSAAMSANGALEAAQAEYQSAVDAMLKMYMKLTMLLGFEAIAPYVEQGAGLVGRGLMGVGGESVSSAATRGLSEAAERAAQEAEVAEAEAARLESALGSLRNSASELEGQAAEISSSIDNLKNSVSSVGNLEDQLATAEKEASSCAQEVTSAEQEVEFANNKVQRISEQQQYISDYEKAEEEFQQYSVNQLDAEAEAEFNDKVNQALAESPAQNAQVDQEVQQIAAQEKQLYDRNRKFYPDGSPQTIDVHEFPPNDQAAYQALENEKKALNQSRLPTAREEIEARFKPELDQKKDAIFKEYRRRRDAAQKAIGKVDPKYDPSFMEAAQQELANRPQELSNLQRTQQEVSQRLETLHTQTSQAQQASTDTTARIADQEGQLKLLQQRIDIANQQIDQTNSQLNAARQTATDKESEARSLRQSVSDSMKDSSTGKDAASSGAALPSPDKSGDPLFGRESGEEQARFLQMAQARIDAARANLEALQQQHDKALDDMNTLKPQLDACIQQHSFWGGDNADS